MSNKNVPELATISGMLSDSDYLPVYDTSASSTNKLTISDYVSVIYENLNLYVATTGSDTTGDGTQLNPWATPNKAIEWLGNKTISANKIINIICGDGTYSGLNTIEIKSHKFKDVYLQGANTYDKTISSINSTSGSVGNYSIILNLNNTTNIAVNDYVLIAYNTSGGTRPETLPGFWKVTNVDSGNNRITINTTHRRSGYIPSGAVTGVLKVIKTILSFANDQNGIVVRRAFKLSNIGLKGNVSSGTPTGIVVGHGSYLDCSNVGVNSFYTGAAAYHSAYLAFSGCGSCANSFMGVMSHNGSFVNATYAVIGGNNDCGLVVVYGASANIDYSVSHGNNSFNFYAVHGSNLNSDNSVKSSSSNSYGVWASDNSKLVFLGCLSNASLSEGIVVINRSYGYITGTHTNNTGSAVNSNRYSYVYLPSANNSYSGNGTNGGVTFENAVIETT